MNEEDSEILKRWLAFSISNEDEKLFYGQQLRLCAGILSQRLTNPFSRVSCLQSLSEAVENKKVIWNIKGSNCSFREIDTISTTQ